MAQAARACGQTKWAQDQLFGRVEGSSHVTVRKRSDGYMPLELCKECRLYHCPFCQPSLYKPKEDYARVWTHIEVHRMRALQHGEFNIYACHLKCRGERHFHCPYCAKTIITRKQFESHMNKCAETQSSSVAAARSPSAALPPAQPAPTVGQCTILLLNLTPTVQQAVTTTQCPAPCGPALKLNSTADQHPAPHGPAVKPNSMADQQPAPPVNPTPPDHPTEPATTACQAAATTTPSVQPAISAAHSSALTDSALEPAGQIFRTARRKIKCPMCNLHLNKKNLKKHNLRKHLISEKDITAKDHLRSQCIDSHSGVYAVAKSYKTTAIPIHVIKKRSGSMHKMVCEEDRCGVIADFRRSSLPNSQCPHLRSVDFCFTRAGKEDLKPDVLEELVANKWIGKDMVAKCLTHRDQAIENRAPLVSLVDLGGSHCLYLSVFEPKMSQFSKLGRLFVTFNVNKRLWHCDCSQGRIPCLHKCVAKWFLFQTNKQLFSSNAKQDAAQGHSEAVEDSPGETSPECSTGIASDDDGLQRMAKYIHKQIKLPFMFPENITQFDSEVQCSQYLVPAETVCQECAGQASLTEPVMITNRARVITLTGVIEDNSTFFKKCTYCDMVYRYQEWSDGLHNYNNHILLSLPLCLFLRNSIQTQTVDSEVVEVLERTVGVKSPCGMEVVLAYLHFEALTSHDCLPAVMMNLYQKGFFTMAGIEIKDLPESFTKEVNAEDFWDAVCLELIKSSLVSKSPTHVAAIGKYVKKAAVSAVTTSLSPTETKKLSQQRTEECHRAVTRYLVKRLHPLSTVESPWFKNLAQTLNPEYQLPSRDQLINTLVPSWYSEEKKHIVKELLHVSKAAVACDWWTNLAHNNFLTVTLHFKMKGQIQQKVLSTKQVYDTQTDSVVAEHIGGILVEFGVRDKVVAVTVGNAFRMDIAIKKLQFRKLTCFAQTLNAAAQKVYTSNAVIRLVSKIRAVITWIKRSSTAEKVLQEKQQLLSLPQHSLIRDVQTRWDSLYLMVERFVEQYAAIQATTTDSHIKLFAEKKRLESLSHDDRQKAADFIRTMKPLYTSSLCVSADKNPTCSQIFPILKKLEAHFQTQDEDSQLAAALKEKAWADLSTCYKDGDTWQFLQESSAMDPRFKNRIDSDEIWDRVKNAAIKAAAATEQISNQEGKRRLLQQDYDADYISEQNDKEPDYSDETPLAKKPRLTALEELFEEEDRGLKSSAEAENSLCISKRVQQEIQLYRKLPAVPTSEDALAWWWKRRETLPLLSELSNSYLCIQASSTPHERVFSTAGDTVSHERSHILPEQAHMQIFLQKNC